MKYLLAVLIAVAVSIITMFIMRGIEASFEFQIPQFLKGAIWGMVYSGTYFIVRLIQADGDFTH